MTENEQKMEHLAARLERLARKQDNFRVEMDELRNEIASLKAAEAVLPASVPAVPADEIVTPAATAPPQPEPAREPETGDTAKEKAHWKTNLEKFIGENLINKIGISVLVIGVGIGVKYAIDRDLVSPLARIILGYLAGAVLFFLAVRMKKTYANFSAVLLSGAMAIFYFITFAAYNFYALIPITATFLLMVLFTVFTVAAAVSYNRQVIAHIGLVGAYAVPFLLDDGSGRVVVMFTYMALLNAGILAVSFMKVWKPLYYSAFGLTWLIFLAWYFPGYLPDAHFALALVFVSIFFLTFYGIFLAFKIGMKERADVIDILMLAINAAILYFIGFRVLSRDPATEDFRGLFTLACALGQGFVAWLLARQRPADDHAVSFLTVLAVLFLTIVFPVQWDGQWVTLLWAAEMCVLFFTGRITGRKVAEILAYPLMLVVFFSLINDWVADYRMTGPEDAAGTLIPVFNICFLSSLLVAASFGAVVYLDRRKTYALPFSSDDLFAGMVKFILPALLITTVYLSLVMEIKVFWDHAWFRSAVTINPGLTFPQHIYDKNLPLYGTLSQILYSLIFLAALSWINLRLVKERVLGLVVLGLDLAGLIVFLLLGIYTLGVLRDSYLAREHADHFYRGFFLVGVRYVSFAAAGLVLWVVSRYVRWEVIKADLRREFDILLHITLLTIAANELINWMDLYQPGQSYKLGLSILAGAYALMLIILGIVSKKMHLRVAALVLFAATLLKLLLYDIAYLNTLSKTIVFVTLGVLLLVSSFLYTRYRGRIFSDHGEPPRE